MVLIERRAMTVRRRFMLVLGCALAALGPGCQQVRPWERGHLADPLLRPDSNPLEAMMAEHMWFSREAASGGRSVGGGGCGCN